MFYLVSTFSKYFGFCKVKSGCKRPYSAIDSHPNTEKIFFRAHPEVVLCSSRLNPWLVGSVLSSWTLDLGSFPMLDGCFTLCFWCTSPHSMVLVYLLGQLNLKIIKTLFSNCLCHELSSVLLINNNNSFKWYFRIAAGKSRTGRGQK